MQNRPDSGLNLAVMNFVLQCAATQSIAAVRELGLETNEIRELMEMTGEDMARLSMCDDRLFTVKINKKAWERIRRNVFLTPSELRNTLIRLEAPRSMIERWWPMRHNEYAQLRSTVTGTDMSARYGGRPRKATTEEINKLWESWVKMTKQGERRVLLPHDYLEIHKATELPLNIIWSLTNDWAAERNYGQPKKLKKAR
ncbi:MAG: STY4526/YPO1902 family pathogenicity island replication protein [Pseudomonadota bacterium]